MVIRLLRDPVIMISISRRQYVEHDAFKLLNRDQMRYVLDPAAMAIPDHSIQAFSMPKANELLKLGTYRTQRLMPKKQDRCFP